MENLEEMRSGIVTINDVLSVVSLNFGAEPRSAASNTKDLRTDHSKMKKFAHNNFKLDESGGDFSKRVEKHCGKKRNCMVRPNLLLSQCFQIFVL